MTESYMKGGWWMDGWMGGCFLSSLKIGQSRSILYSRISVHYEAIFLVVSLWPMLVLGPSVHLIGPPTRSCGPPAQLREVSLSTIG